MSKQSRKDCKKNPVYEGGTQNHHLSCVNLHVISKKKLLWLIH